MDTISTSVSSWIVPSFHTTSRDLYNFKTLIPSIHNTLHHHLTSPTKPSPVSNKTPSFNTSQNFNPTFLFSSSKASQYQSSTIYQKPSSGYAAALLDISLCSNTLESVHRDAKRVSKLLRNKQLFVFMNDAHVSDNDKGEVIKELAEKGRFQKQLVALLKMLVDKKKVGLVGEVMEEFDRIYDEFSGTKVVMVSSAKKIEEDQLLGIAQRVQKFSGAMKVKVKNLIHEGMPSFAV